MSKYVYITCPSCDSKVLYSEAKCHNCQAVISLNLYSEDILEINNNPISWAGGIYHGELLDGIPEGSGKLIFPNGTIYHGEWIKGKPNGYGIICYKNGGSYQGYFFNGKRHGHGLYHAMDGRGHAGMWENGQLTSPYGKEDYNKLESYVIKKNNLFLNIKSKNSKGDTCQLVNNKDHKLLNKGLNIYKYGASSEQSSEKINAYNFLKAPLEKRIVAFFVDSTIGFFPYFLLFFIILYGVSLNVMDVLRFTFICWGLLYILARDAIGSGQSWGKRIMGLMVIDLQKHRPCTIAKSALRNIVLSLPYLVFLMVGLYYIIYDSYGSSAHLIIFPVQAIVIIVELIACLTNENGRRIFDMVANTQVIEANQL